MARKAHKETEVKIKITEPSFIMGIGSITPRIDYSQGNEFYNEFITLDDIHKPALDGIGYQDSLNWQRAWWDDNRLENNNRIEPSVGKTVAWLNYMTNINRTFGNFASLVNLGIGIGVFIAYIGTLRFSNWVRNKLGID